MADPLKRYRDEIVRAVLGSKPAIQAREANPAGLECLCRRLLDAEGAIQLLCANGYDWPAHSLTDLVRRLLQPGERE